MFLGVKSLAVAPLFSWMHCSLLFSLSFVSAAVGCPLRTCVTWVGGHTCELVLRVHVWLKSTSVVFLQHLRADTVDCLHSASVTSPTTPQWVTMAGVPSLRREAWAHWRSWTSALDLQAPPPAPPGCRHYSGLCLG